VGVEIEWKRSYSCVILVEGVLKTAIRRETEEEMEE
jgi:hypothetical protein